MIVDFSEEDSLKNEFDCDQPPVLRVKTVERTIEFSHYDFKLNITN